MSSGKKAVGVSHKVWGYSATILAANTGVYLIGSGHPLYGGLAVIASFGANYCTEFGIPAKTSANGSSQVESTKVETPKVKSPNAEKIMAGARS